MPEVAQGLQTAISVCRTRSGYQATVWFPGLGQDNPGRPDDVIIERAIDFADTKAYPRFLSDAKSRAASRNLGHVDWGDASVPLSP